MSRILLVEDEKSLSGPLALNLGIEGYEVDLAENGNRASELFSASPESFDLVILDIMLPDLDGFALCSRFKQLRSDIPVIFLSAKGMAADRIGGLKLGAEDYITKPFDLEELLLRVQNVIKRARPQVSSESVFRFGNCSVDFETYEIKDNRGNEHTLSRREIALLKMLADNANKVISRDEIIEKLWTPEENPSGRTIDNYILNFRKLFEPDQKNPSYFHSVRGVGYKFTP
jgi:two-component system, OmpR family, alkaline phosphatase synthesis response regulator PhoP